LQLHNNHFLLSTKKKPITFKIYSWMHFSRLYIVMAFDLHNIKFDFTQTIILLMKFCLKLLRLHEKNDLAKVSESFS